MSTTITVQSRGTTSLTLSGTGQTLVQPVTSPSISIAVVGGAPGPRGEQGEPGFSASYDPGDITLIFDNQLI